MNGELPKNIKSILTDDETVEEVFPLKDCEVYATNKRLIETSKRRISDYTYNHISSITYESKRNYWLVLIGLLAIAAGIWLRDVTNNTLSWVVIIIGLVFAIGALFIKKEWVEIHVVGLGHSIRYRNDKIAKEKLNSLLHIVRQNKIPGKPLPFVKGD